MIDQILQRLCQNPHSLFSESELRHWDAEAFEDFTTVGLLKRTTLEYSRATAIRDGRLLRVVSGPQDASIEAIDEDDIDFAPVLLQVDDLLLWEFDIQAWARDFNRRHEIEGEPTLHRDRLWHLGVFGTADVFFACAQDKASAEVTIQSLRGLSSRPIALLPAHMPRPLVDFSPSAPATASLTPGGFGVVPALFEALRAQPDGGFREPVPGFRQSIDSRSVSWNGEVFPLTPQQVQVVELLLDAYLNGTPDIGQGYLLDRIGTTANDLRHTFRDSSAWGRLVVPGGTRGAFRLAL